MVGDINNTIGISFFGLIYIVAVFLVVIQHFSGYNFGILGILCWIIVVVGAIGFVIYVILSLTGGN